MKKLTNLAAAALTAVALFIGTNVKAQTTPASALRFGIGLETGIPTGNLKDYSNFELGGTARLQYGLSNNLALTLTSGYYNFFANNGIKDIGGKSVGIVPIKAGIKAFFADNLYFGAEGGVGLETKYDKNTKLLLSPGLGYASKSWDVGVRYENFSGQSDNYGTVGLRIAYGFGL